MQEVYHVLMLRYKWYMLATSASLQDHLELNIWLGHPRYKD